MIYGYIKVHIILKVYKGIDNIITDEPVMAREVVYSRNTSETITNMIKYVFNK